MFALRHARKSSAWPFSFVILLSCLTVTLVGFVDSAARNDAAAATRPSAGADTSIPLLLVHGFNDDCTSAWRKSGYDSSGNQLGNTVAAADYFGTTFSMIKKIGYYTSSANNTDANDNNSGVCDVNLQNPPSPTTTPPGPTVCNQLTDIVSQPIAFGTKDEPIDRLACLLAWYIYFDYTQFGQPVNVLAHSMGGLLIRYALGATDAGVFGFPPSPLWVSNVVTVATPHTGIYGAYRTAAQQNNSTNGVELDDMNPGSAFMTTIGAVDLVAGTLK